MAPAPQGFAGRIGRDDRLGQDGTVSVLGLVFGVAATASSNNAVRVAGASGAAPAAVSMMAGAFLEAETDRDEKQARQRRLETDLHCDPGGVNAMLADRLTTVGLGSGAASSATLARTVLETAGVGIAAALAGVGIGVLSNRSYGGG